MGAAAVVGLAASCGVEVFADAVGVDQPGGHAGGCGDRGRGDRGAGGFQGVERGQGASAFVVAVLGAGRFQPCGAVWLAVVVLIRSPLGPWWAISGIAAGGPGPTQDLAGLLRPRLAARGRVRRAGGASCRRRG